MKKFFFTFLACFFCIYNAFSQTYPRQKVLAEVFTGTWCSYCPGAQMGIDDFYSGGYNLAAVAYHVSDGYETTASVIRNDYYGISAYPNVIFDGTEDVPGGSINTSMFPAYLPPYNTRIMMPSGLSIALSSALLPMELIVDIDITHQFQNESYNLFCVLTESHIEESWMGQTEINNVQRYINESGNGQTLDFIMANPVSESFNISLDPSWNLDNMEVVVFVQNLGTQEVLQANSLFLGALPAPAVPLQSTPFVLIFLSLCIIGLVVKLRY